MSLRERRKVVSHLFPTANSFILSIMNHMTHLKSAVRRFPIGMLAVGLFTSPIFAQTTKIERDLIPSVTVTDLGEGRPIILRWFDPSNAASTLQVTSRTVPTLLENGIDLKEDAKAILVNTSRPPIERFWTIQGQIRASEDSATPLARWRVLNGAARLFMIRPEGIPEATINDADREPPKKSATDKAEEKSDQNRATGTAIKSPFAPNGAVIERARAYARVQDNAASRCAGAAISQNFSGYGLVPTSIQIRLETASPRNIFEVERLTSILRLAEPVIPNQPVGVGASWTSRWTNLEQGTPIETVMTWTLSSVDQAALEATGVAETAVLAVRYTRRIPPGLAEPVPPRVAARLEANGSGEVRVNLRRPMHLDAQLVQMPPPRDPAQPGATDVTRMRVVTTD